ncbi:MAG TPA: DUF2213 domain-containing protein [Thermoanaerobaculia bacterium]|nr:DUF2213 domain-containing protein [Thermoanaerobaculia bacterium]
MGLLVDASPLEKAERLPNGFLRAPATLTRAGVFVYRFADGTTRRELRPPEEVFAADSLATLEMAVLTLEHPMPIGTPVTADNARQLQVGHVGDTLERDGDRIRGRVLVTDSQAVSDVENGKRQEISLGYWREIDPTPGSWRGQAYDVVQRKIRYNHAAITERGRAGPDVRIRLDSESAVLVEDAAEDDPRTGEEPMKKTITVDGISIELEERDAQIVEKALGERDKKLESLDSQISEARKMVDAEKARADAAEAEKKKLDKQVTDSLSPERIAELVEARLDLERDAEPILNADKADNEKVDLSPLKDAEIKRRVILVADSEAKLDGVSDDYLQARYDASLAFLTSDSYREGKERADKSRANVREVVAKPGSAKESAAEKARERMVNDTHDAWKKGLDGYDDGAKADK